MLSLVAGDLCDTLLHGFVNVGSPPFPFPETGRPSARNIVGGLPALCGKCCRSFQTLNSLLLCSSERNSEKPLEGVP